MEKFLFTYIADVREYTMIRQSELTIKEGLEISKAIWDEGGHDVYSEIVVNTVDKLFVCSMFPFKPYYHVAAEYKYLEPAIKEVCDYAFKMKVGDN